MPSCMLMNPLLYVESVVEALKPFDTLVILPKYQKVLTPLQQIQHIKVDS